jgi:hypothetical protein
LEELNVGVIGGRVRRARHGGASPESATKSPLWTGPRGGLRASSGEVPIYEPGLAEFVSRLLSATVEVN